MKSARSASGARRHARLGLMAVAGAGILLALALPGRPIGGSVIRGAGTSWQRVADIAFGDRRRAHHHRHRASGPAAGFRIGGSVDGLYPGLATGLVLTVVNPQHFPLVVTSITTKVGTPKPGCVATNLTVHPFTGRLRISARGSAKVSVLVMLVHSAPDACQGAVFPLRYSGLARR